MDRKEKLKNLMRQRKAERSATQRGASKPRLSMPIGTSAHTKRQRTSDSFSSHQSPPTVDYAHETVSVSETPQEDRNAVLARIEAEELSDLPQLWMHGGLQNGADRAKPESSFTALHQDPDGTEDGRSKTFEMGERPRKVRKKTEHDVPVDFYDAPEKDPRRVEAFLDGWKRFSSRLDRTKDGLGEDRRDLGEASTFGGGRDISRGLPRSVSNLEWMVEDADMEAEEATDFSSMNPHGTHGTTQLHSDPFLITSASHEEEEDMADVYRNLAGAEGDSPFGSMDFIERTHISKIDRAKRTQLTEAPSLADLFAVEPQTKRRPSLYEETLTQLRMKRMEERSKDVGRRGSGSSSSRGGRGVSQARVRDGRANPKHRPDDENELDDDSEEDDLLFCMDWRTKKVQ